MAESAFFPNRSGWKKAVSVLLENEPAFEKVIQANRGQQLTVQRARSVYEYLLRAIVYQQITGSAAATIHGNFLKLFPGYRPNPDRLLRMSETKLRSAGLSRPKLKAIRDLASFQKQRLLPGFAKLGRMDDEEIIEKLTAVHGVGVWTVQMLLIFQLARPDVLPAHDLGVREGATVIINRRQDLTVSQLEKRARRWAPYRSIASWYCWRATEL